MFGFFEILVLAIVAFLVLGPEEFPKAARKFVRVINSLKTTFLDLKTEMNEIKQETEESFFKVKEEIKEVVQKPIHDISQEAKEQFSKVKESVSSATKNMTKKEEDFVSVEQPKEDENNE